MVMTSASPAASMLTLSISWPRVIGRSLSATAWSSTAAELSSSTWLRSTRSGSTSPSTSVPWPTPVLRNSCTVAS